MIQQVHNDKISPKIDMYATSHICQNTAFAIKNNVNTLKNTIPTFENNMWHPQHTFQNNWSVPTYYTPRHTSPL